MLTSFLAMIVSVAVVAMARSYSGRVRLPEPMFDPAADDDLTPTPEPRPSTWTAPRDPVAAPAEDATATAPGCLLGPDRAGRTAATMAMMAGPGLCTPRDGTR